MTEKRFTMDLDGFFYDNHRKKNSANIYDNNTFIGSVIIGAKFIIDLLNELDEKYVDEFALRETLQQELQIVENKNEQLKKENKWLKSIHFTNDVLKENKMLKEKLNDILKLTEMTGIDDLIICPRCLKHMGEEVNTMVCQYCGYNEKEELIKENNEFEKDFVNKELKE